MATYDIESLPEPPYLSRLIAVVKMMHYTNSALNPLVYSVRNPEMRRTMTAILAKWLPLRTPLPPHATAGIRLRDAPSRCWQTGTPEANANRPETRNNTVFVTVGRCNKGMVLSRPTSLVQVASHA